MIVNNLDFFYNQLHIAMTGAIDDKLEVPDILNALFSLCASFFLSMQIPKNIKIIMVDEFLSKVREFSLKEIDNGTINN